MTNQHHAIAAATEFLTTYVLSNRELNAQFKTVLNKREAKDLDKEVVGDTRISSSKTDLGKNEISSAFWKEIRWSLSQATVESFLKFFKQHEDNEESAREALKNVCVIGFDLSNTSSLSDYISSTEPFQEYKQKSLLMIKRQLVEEEAKFNEYKGSGQAVNTTEQKNHDSLVGHLREVIGRGGQPILTPPEFVKCYTAVLDDVVIRANEVMQWSSNATPKTKTTIRRKKVPNAD